MNVKIKKAYCPPKIVEGSPSWSTLNTLSYPGLMSSQWSVVQGISYAISSAWAQRAFKLAVSWIILFTCSQLYNYFYLFFCTMVWLIYVHASIQSRTFKSYEELIADYESGELHPADLKPALSKSLNKILEVMVFLLC